MTKEESIAFAEKLQKNYANLDAAKEQIAKNESEIKSRSTHKVKGHSYFKYFWPWILAAVVIYFLIGFIHKMGFRYAMDDVQYTLINLRRLIPFFTLVTGAIVAGVKKANNSHQVSLAEQSTYDTIAKLELANKDNLKKIERIVLSHHRLHHRQRKPECRCHSLDIHRQFDGRRNGRRHHAWRRRAPWWMVKRNKKILAKSEKCNAFHFFFVTLSPNYESKWTRYRESTNCERSCTSITIVTTC